MFSSISFFEFLRILLSIMSDVISKVPLRFGLLKCSMAAPASLRIFRLKIDSLFLLSLFSDIV
ncbi:hypothetical protein D3C76_1335600 [compost metagenome]